MKGGEKMKIEGKRNRLVLATYGIENIRGGIKWKEKTL